MAVVRGSATIVHDDAVRLRAGDIAVVRGPEPWTVADDPSTAPQAVIHPGQQCRTPDGEDLSIAMAFGVRSWGTHLSGTTALLTGVYELGGDVSRRLLTALPQRLVVRAGDVTTPLPQLLFDEAAKDEPGQQAVLDRLLDVLLIAVLRTWFARPDAEAPGWYRAHADPVVGPALRLLHEQPASPWTLATLAAEVGISRA